MRFLRPLLSVLGVGRIVVDPEGFKVERSLKSERFIWNDVDEVYGTVTFGYGTFSIVLSGGKELQLGFDLGTEALISAFTLKLPGFPHDWFSQVRNNGYDDFSLLWMKSQAAQPQKSQGLSVAYQQLMEALDPPASDKALDLERVGPSAGRSTESEKAGRAAYVFIYASIAVLVVAFAAYWEFVTKVRLTNHSNATLVKARIELDYVGPVLWEGDLAPGQSVWVWEMATGGKVALSYDQRGKKTQYFLGYAGAPGPFNGSSLVGVYDNGGIDITRVPTVLSAVFGIVDAVME